MAEPISAQQLYKRSLAVLQRIEFWLLCSAFVVLLNGSSKSNSNKSINFSPSLPSARSSSGKSTYSSKSIRNYNSGARYYMRRVDSKMTLQTFGYSFYQVDSYYQSGYGYSVYYPAYLYWPCYVDATYVYYPPMFQYFYKWNGRYWNGEEARYVCRNDNAFWPVENQTSEFVQGRLPALDMTQFDTELSDAWDSVSVGVREQNMTVLNSLEVGKVLSLVNVSCSMKKFNDMNAYSLAEANSSSMRSLRKILAYRFFACPDGKDPNEIYCCGSLSAQYCCSLETLLSVSSANGSDRLASIFVPVLVFLALSVAVIFFTLYRRGLLRCECRVQNATVVTATSASRQVTNMVPSLVTVTTEQDYHAVPDEPPSYASCEDAPPTYTSPIVIAHVRNATAVYSALPAASSSTCTTMGSSLASDDDCPTLSDNCSNPPPYELVSDYPYMRPPEYDPVKHASVAQQPIV